MENTTLWLTGGVSQNTYQIKEKTIYVRLGKKIVVIVKHLITNVFKISNIGYKEQKQVDKYIAEAMS